MADELLSLLAPEFDRLGGKAVDTLKAGLLRRVPKRSPNGRTYQSNAVATGRTLRETRYELVQADGALRLIIYSSEYWRNVDQGSPAGTQVSPAEILRWMQAKGVGGGLRRAQLIARQIEVRGTNPEPNRFATRALPAIITELTDAVRTVVESFGDELRADAARAFTPVPQ